MALVWKPLEKVGGDIFWYRREQNGFLVAVVDCTGHGVSGAFVAQTVAGILNRAMANHGGSSPAKLVHSLHLELAASISQASDWSWLDFGCDIVVCRVEPRTRMITFCGAGIPLYLKKGEAVRRVVGDRRGIGFEHHARQHRFEDQQIQLQVGEAVILMTDGLRSQLGGNTGRPFEEKRLLRSLSCQSDLKEAIAATELDLEDYRGEHNQTDDMTLLGLAV